MRATLDKLISWAGLLLAVVLLVAGGLLTWASSFIGNQVHDQLAAQHITMPTSQTGLAALPAADQAALEKYAGQQLTTGPQAKAYANHYISVHMHEAHVARPTPRSAASTSSSAAPTRRRPPPACQDLGGAPPDPVHG